MISPVKALATLARVKSAPGTENAPRYISLGDARRLERPEWDHEKAVEAWEASVAVFNAIQVRGVASKAVPLIAYYRQGGEWVAAPDDATGVETAAARAMMLQRLLEKPNPRMSLPEYQERRNLNKLLFGNWLAKKVTLDTRPPLRNAGKGSDGKTLRPLSELWPLPPGFKPNVDTETGYPESYTPPGKTKDDAIPAAQVVHEMCPHPSNTAWGTPPLKAAGLVVDADLEAMRWNLYAMEHRAVMDGLLTTDTYPSDAQWAQAQQMRREQWEGSGNARGVKMMGGGWKYHQLARDAVEMDFIKSLSAYIVRISMAFGLTPPLVSGEFETFANYQGAWRAMWLSTVIPDLDDECAVLRREVLPHFGAEGELWIGTDTSKVHALREIMIERLDELETALRAGVPYNQAIELLDLALDPIEGIGDIPHGVSLPSAMARSSRPPEEPVPKAGRKSAALISGRKTDGAREASAPLFALAERMRGRIRDLYREAAELAQREVEFERMLDAVRTGGAADVVAAARLDRLMGELGLHAHTVAQQMVTEAGEYGATVLSQRAGKVIRPDASRLALFGTSLVADALDHIRRSSEKGLAHALTRFRDPGDNPLAELDDAGRELAELFAGLGVLNSQQAESVTKIVESAVGPRGAREALGLGQRAARGYLAERADTIGTDLGVRGAWGGQREVWSGALEGGEIQRGKKMWIDADDGRVCPTCISLDGQVVDLDQPYFASNIGAYFRGPGDPHPGTCRCGELLLEVG